MHQSQDQTSLARSNKNQRHALLDNEKKKK
jgi:hypothetical protein